MLSYNKVHTMFSSVTEHWVDQSRANTCCLSCVLNHNGKKQNRVSKAWSDHWRVACLCSENGANSGRRGIQMKIVYKSRSFGASSESVQTSSEDLDWGEGQLLSVQLPQMLSKDTFQPLPFPDLPCFSSLGLSFLAVMTLWFFLCNLSSSSILCSLCKPSCTHWWLWNLVLTDGGGARGIAL